MTKTLHGLRVPRETIKLSDDQEFEVRGIGSGDLELRNVQGAVSIDSVGSGDVDVRDVRGAVSVGSLGSGDVEVRNAASLQVRRTGSGSVNHSGITGTVDLPKKR